MPGLVDSVGWSVFANLVTPLFEKYPWLLLLLLFPGVRSTIAWPFRKTCSVAARIEELAIGMLMSLSRDLGVLWARRQANSLIRKQRNVYMFRRRVTSFVGHVFALSGLVVFMFTFLMTRDIHGILSPGFFPEPAQTMALVLWSFIMFMGIFRIIILCDEVAFPARDKGRLSRIYKYLNASRDYRLRRQRG